MAQLHATLEFLSDLAHAVPLPGVGDEGGSGFGGEEGEEAGGGCPEFLMGAGVPGRPDPSRHPPISTMQVRGRAPR